MKGEEEKGEEKSKRDKQISLCHHSFIDTYPFTKSPLYIRPKYPFQLCQHVKEKNDNKIDAKGNEKEIEKIP